MFSERTNWKLALNRFTQALEEVRAGGAKVLDLTVSNPTRVGLHYDEPAILGALASPRVLDYDPQPLGLLSAREAVCGYYADHGVTISPERVLLTTSTSEAYSFLFRMLCDSESEVVVPQPGYPRQHP